MARAIEQLRQAMEACELGALSLPDQIDALMDAGKEVLQEVSTLTPPNELLTCEGCACEEYRRDTYPCNCCARNDETISDQYRPPEGEEDA